MYLMRPACTNIRYPFFSDIVFPEEIGCDYILYKFVVESGCLYIQSKIDLVLVNLRLSTVAEISLNYEQVHGTACCCGLTIRTGKQLHANGDMCCQPHN